MFTFPTPSTSPAALQQPQTFYCSLTRSLLLPAVMAVFGYVLTASVLVLTSSHWPHSHAPFIAAGLCALLFLLITESVWFGLTCRRFAEISQGELVLFGAFSRVRLRCKLDAARFGYSTGVHCYPTVLLVEFANGRLQRFPLNLCAEPAKLTRALGAVNRFEQEKKCAQAEAEQINHTQQQLLRTYFLFFVLPVVGIALVQNIVHVFWSIQLLPSAWYAGIMLGAIATLPLCIWFLRPLRHFRFMNLPAHHHWRRNAFGNALAEALFYLKFSTLMLCIGAAYSAFFAHNIGWLSLMPHTHQAAIANISARSYSEGCSRGRSKNNWKLHVQLPAPHSHFNGDWCSLQSVRSAPPSIGPHTVYLRESRFARELTLEP